MLPYIYIFIILNWLRFIDVAVMNSATVKDLKLVIKKKVNESEQSKMGHRHISWFVPFLPVNFFLVVEFAINVVLNVLVSFFFTFYSFTL